MGLMIAAALAAALASGEAPDMHVNAEGLKTWPDRAKS